MTKKIKEMLRPREAVAGLDAYDPEHHDVLINLSANENSYGLPAAVRSKIDVLSASLALNRYPDPLATDVRKLIGKREDLPSARIVVGNGGDELIQQLLLAYGGAARRAVAFTPTFVMYGILSELTATEFTPLPRGPDFALRADFGAQAREAGADIIFVCTPNNPSGNLVSNSEIAELAREFPRSLVVVDEAYHEFSRETARALLDRFENLIILRTFSKAFSLAGLRLGYMLASEEVIANILKVKLPYNVNVFSQAAAAVLLGNLGQVETVIGEIISERDRLFKALSAISGLTPYPSAANFILVGCAPGATKVWRRLLDEGILVRNFDRAPGLDNCLRITVGTREENDRVVEVLSLLFSSG